MDDLKKTQVNELMKKFYNQLKKINKKNIIFFQSAFPISSTFTKMKDFQYINWLLVTECQQNVYDGFYRPSFYAQNIERKSIKFNDIISIVIERFGANYQYGGQEPVHHMVRDLNTSKNVLQLELPQIHGLS